MYNTQLQVVFSQTFVDTENNDVRHEVDIAKIPFAFIYCASKTQQKLYLDVCIERFLKTVGKDYANMKVCDNNARVEVPDDYAGRNLVNIDYSKIEDRLITMLPISLEYWKLSTKFDTALKQMEKEANE